MALRQLFDVAVHAACSCRALLWEAVCDYLWLQRLWLADAAQRQHGTAVGSMLLHSS
jgi:hypothetical protein